MEREALPAATADFRPADALAGVLRRMLGLGGFLLLLMSSFRAAFVLRYGHPDVLSEFFADLPAAFGLGVLHDLRVTLLFLLPGVLSLLWMRDAQAAAWKKWLSVAHCWCFVGIVVLLTVLISDFLFYSFFQSHFSVLAWGMIEDDFGAVVAGAWKIYPIPFFALLILLAGWLLVRILRRVWSPARLLAPRVRHERVDEAVRWLNLQLTLHVAITVGLLSWSLSPTPSRLASELPPSRFVHQVPLNGVEELAGAVWLRLTEEPLSVAARFAYSGDRGAALRDFTGAEAEDEPGAPTLSLLPVQSMLPQPQWDRPPHVVLVVMESFSEYLLRWQSPDFDLLGALAPYWERGWVFERFLPSDNGSAGSILSLAVNLPYRPGTKQLSQSDERGKAFSSASGTLFAKAGYETRFLYGGPLEWRSVGEFLPLQGFQEVVGQAQILAELGLDEESAASDWGIFDEHLFTAAARRLESAKTPQFIVLFTTTNHPPHELPPDCPPQSLQPPVELLARIRELDPLQRLQLRTYHYACNQFGQFLQRLEKDGLLGQVVVGATGDHTIGGGIPFTSSELLLERAVPFFLLAPPAQARQFQPNFNRPGSHKDVVPTLVHLAGLGNGQYRGIGCSLLDETATPFGYNPSGLFMDENAVVVEFEGGFGTMTWAGPGALVTACEETGDHRRLLARTRAALALTDWIVCEPDPKVP